MSMSESEARCDGEGAQSNHFDIVKGLHSRCLNNLLEVVFKYLDADSLRNAELTCKAWKAAAAAASDSNPKKLWHVLLHKQMSTSPLWERLNYCLRSELPQQSNDCWSSRKLFSKIEFTAKALKKNWLKNDFSREYVDIDVGLRRCVYMMRNKFIALWEPINGVFKIWNRMTLEVEEVFHGPQNHLELIFEVFEDALLYSTKHDIFIRNLTTQTTEIYRPFPSELTTKFITSLRVVEGFLCILVLLVKGTKLCNDVVIWKMISPTEIDWKNPRTIPTVKIDNTRIFMDDRYIIFAHLGTSWISCDVYHMRNLQKNKKSLKFSRTRAELMYQDGYLFMVTEMNEIKIMNVETGKSRIIGLTGVDFSQPNNFMRMHSDYIFVCTNLGCSNVRSRIQIWDLKEAIDPSTKLPLQPFSSHELIMDRAMILHVDAFGILAVNRELDLNSCERDVIWMLNFLPICNCCKRVKKRLLICAPCKSAKYCGLVCQKADWNHHKSLCRKIRDHQESK